MRLAPALALALVASTAQATEPESSPRIDALAVHPANTTAAMRSACTLSLYYVSGEQHPDTSLDDASESDRVNAIYCSAWIHGFRDNHCVGFNVPEALGLVLADMRGGAYDDLDFFKVAATLLWQHYPCPDTDPA